jgi:AraC family transcriptional regulator
MLQPLIAEKPALNVVGRRRAFIHALSPDANNFQVIGPLWGEFLGRVQSIPHRIGRATYGVLYGLPEAERSHPHELQYIAAAAVSRTDEVPAGMIAWTASATTFAVFEHRGPIRNLAATCREIYSHWLPASSYEHSGIADVEIYDERFCPDGEDSVMEYWVSVKPKA